MMPVLSPQVLEAFAAIAETRSFTKAARRLHVTQSTLSHRIRQLETEIGGAVFLRKESGTELTEAGTLLVRYCQMRGDLDRQYLAPLLGSHDQTLRGALRVAGYSTVMRSLVIPVLTPFLREHPQLQFQFRSTELRELPQLLISGSVDFVLSDAPVRKAKVQSAKVAEEVYVLVESREHRDIPDVFLDDDEDDTTTLRFFEHQPGKHDVSTQRRFMGDIFAILDGVAAGLGRAVVPRHLLDARRELVVVSDFFEMREPVYLSSFVQPYHSKVHDEAATLLRKGLAARLQAVQAG